MNASFWFKFGLSFFVGSLWVTLTTMSAERFGNKVGGLIGSLPSTVVIALLFIGYTQSPQVAAQATTVMPLAQGLNGLFLLTFMILIRRGLWSALGIAPIALDEFIHSHPDFCPLQAPELPALQADIIVGPHQPPGEQILPKLAKTP
jgi:hypothetical protein